MRPGGSKRRAAAGLRRGPAGRRRFVVLAAAAAVLVAGAGAESLAIDSRPPSPFVPLSPFTWTATAHAAVPPSAEPRLVARGGVADAKRWARARSGSVAFAVADGKRIRGVNVNQRFPSASVVKAMLALAVVRGARGRELTATERALLGPMIRVSDNDSASTVYRRVGAAGLYAVARAARMTRFADVGNWADAQLTAADQARLFLRIDKLAPGRHRSYLRGLLASIVSWQRWGIAPVASERGFTIMFKGGWRRLINHQAALLERDGRRIALAVLTSGSGGDYGQATEWGIASRVLATRPARGGA